MKVHVTARAGRDLEEIRDYYLRANPNVVERVRDEILNAIGLLRMRPDIGIRSIRKPDIRSKLVIGLPYRIHYRIHAGTLEIVHIRHTARQPWP